MPTSFLNLPYNGVIDIISHVVDKTFSLDLLIPLFQAWSLQCGDEVNASAAERLDQIAAVQWADAIVNICKRTVTTKLRPPGAAVAIPLYGTNWMLRAFPSGRTTRAAAVAGATIERLLTGKGSICSLGQVVVIEIRMLIQAALRVLAGVHSVEDVVAGCIFGHICGYSIPKLREWVSESIQKARNPPKKK